MVELRDVVEYLDKEIDITSVQDKCQNGLQIEGKQKVEKAAVVVDITLKTIKKAINEGCDIIVSHHALIWEPPKVITGLLAKRMKLLVKNDISVYTVHLPLDVHKKYSHGKLIADELGLYGLSKFGNEDGNLFGFSGNIKKKMSHSDLKKMVDLKLGSNSRMIPYGPKEISKICIVSGGGGFAVEEASTEEVDCYITGEMKHSDLMAAKDLGINVLLAGHYDTEKLGMVKLSHSLTKKFKIQCVFVES